MDQQIDERAEAAAFRRLVAHLQQRGDVQNVDLMGVGGFCRNCLSDWLAEASGVSQATARQHVHGMPYDAWKAAQPAASPKQLERMAASVAKNRTE